MFKNYLKIAARNLVKNRSHTLINVSGLTLGVVCALVIFLVIQYDLSFDTWHEDGNRIYRIVSEDTEYGRQNFGNGGPNPLAKAIRDDVYGLENVTLVNTNLPNSPVVSKIENDKLIDKFKEEDVAFVEQDYFNIFSYRWISGNSENSLERPNTAVITKSLAEKLFEDLNVVGQQIVLNVGFLIDLEITGVVDDQPDNSDFPFKLLIAAHSRERGGESFENDTWSSSSSAQQVYVKLSPGTSVEEVNAQFDPLIARYRDEYRADHLEYFLQPLSDIHFDSRFGNYSGRTIEKSSLFALGIIGLLLLLTACINFINLNTAIAVRRSKEVGLRKTLGGTRTQLTFHFLGETALTTFIALIIGVAATEVVLGFLEPILGFGLQLELLNNSTALMFLLVLFGGITLAAGWYPARYLSSFSPIEAIRNKMNASYGRGLTLRRSLIVVQFTITQILIIGTIIIASQIKYFESQDLGYDEDAIIEVEIPDQDKQVLDTFKNRLKNHSSIKNVTFSNTGTTSNNTWAGNYLVMEDSVRLENNAQVKYVDADFVDTYGLTILAGEDLTPSDSVNKYLVNEAFARQIGYGDNYEDLIGKHNLFWGDEAPIVGVVKDFNTQSLHRDLEPTILATQPNYFVSGIKIDGQRTADALETIEDAYTAAFPNFVFGYSFLDENIAEMYESEQRTAQIMNLFTFAAILIGCLGLFGLVSYMATTRTKEIGVRKVLGASSADILRIFASEITLLTGISFLLAAPVSWYLMQQWLADFAYKIEIGFGIFALAFGGTILIAALTVGYKSLNAALANPVNSLKSE